MKTQIYLLLAIILISCKSDLNNESKGAKLKFIKSFQFDKVLYSTNEETGVLESKIQIPSDFPGHKDYSRYGEDELHYGEMKLRSHIEYYSDSIVVYYDTNNGGCFMVSPKERISGETLILDYKLEGDGCKEEEVYRLKYVIEDFRKFKEIKIAGKIFSTKK